jgi:spore germination protein KB
MIGTSVLIAPSGLAHDAGQDGWMAGLLGALLNVLFVWLYTALGGRYPDRTLTQMCEAVLGKWPGKAIALAFVAFFYLLASLMVGDLGFFLTSQIIPETPIEVVMIMFIIVVLIAVRSGLVVYSRAAEFFFPWMMILFILLIVPLIPKFQSHHLIPMLEYGPKPILKGGFSFSGLQEMVVMLMFYTYVRNEKKRGRAFLLGTAIGGGALVVITLWSIAVLGANISANQLFPAYTLAKHMNIGHFMERVEGVMIFIWILSIFIKIALTFHAAVLGLAQITGIGDEKPLFWPLGFGILPFALLCYPNAIYVRDFIAKIWTPFALIFIFFLPVLLYVVSLIRGLRQ